MAVSVAFTPTTLSFSGAAPGSSGPDITVDPSFGPPQVSFAGAVQIKNVPVAANLTAQVTSAGSVFKVRDIIAMDWVSEEVDPGELPPGHHGPPPKVLVLEVSDRSDGVTPLAVTANQYVLVRIQYTAPTNGGGSFSGMLSIMGDSWEPIAVPLSLSLSSMSTRLVSPTPVTLAQGTTTEVQIAIQAQIGAGSIVRYEVSPTQLHAGVSIIGQNEFPVTANEQTVSLQLSSAPDAPLGENALAINQFYLNQRIGFFVPIVMKPLSSVQKIRGLTIALEPRDLVFNFMTIRLSIPNITIWARGPGNDPLGDMIPANQLATATSNLGPQTSHMIGVSGLPDGAALWFRIDANVKQSGVDPSASARSEGVTATLHRDCNVFLDRLHILQAGGDDTGPEDGNDIDFSVVAYDAATGRQVCSQVGHTFNSVDSGIEYQHIALNDRPFLPILRAPNTLAVYVRGTCFDPDGGLGIIGTMVPTTLPTTQDSGASEDGAWADSFQSYAPHRLVGDQFSDTLTLTSGLTLLAFDAFFRVETIVSDPHGALNIVYVDV
jgi:hypothetical protein